jgi:hypothetical protein
MNRYFVVLISRKAKGKRGVNESVSTEKGGREKGSERVYFYRGMREGKGE